jgi:hypothetical protein
MHIEDLLSQDRSRKRRLPGESFAASANASTSLSCRTISSSSSCELPAVFESCFRPGIVTRINSSQYYDELTNLYPKP